MTFETLAWLIATHCATFPISHGIPGLIGCKDNACIWEFIFPMAISEEISETHLTVLIRNEPIAQWENYILKKCTWQNRWELSRRGN